MNRSAVLAFAIHSAAALVLGVAGVAKLLQPYFAAVALSNRTLLQGASLADVVMLVRLVAICELVVAAMTVRAATRRAGSWPMIILGGAFLASAIGDFVASANPAVDCGCFGGLVNPSMGLRAVMALILISSGLLCSSSPGGPRGQLRRLRGIEKAPPA
jgi:hypothetical protein